jgi:molybdopterin converting factor small subunit
VESVEVNAGTIRELLTKLIERYPELNTHMETGIAVSIDGQIFRDNWSTEIPENAEVFLLPRLQGG